jgi:hypothetical protein
MPPHSSRWSCKAGEGLQTETQQNPGQHGGASEWGMIFISRANRPVTPHSTISALAKINTPTAWQRHPL